jgi:diguanylate cyclase (GGDEF)-like protein
MLQNLLVIDDDPRIHALVKAQFDPQLFKIFASHSGAAGLQMAVEIKPDLILLDVDLPDAQGFEICRRLKIDRETRLIPVIFLTGVTGLEATIFGLECGATDYLIKPFRPSELRARVRVAMGTRARIEILNRQSLQDELTGLCGRKYFELRLDAELAMARRSGHPLGCILLDIDKMSLVNLSFGDAAGDELLKAVGEAIRAVHRREDAVCRLEEDTYAVLIGNARLLDMHEIAIRTRLAVRRVGPLCNAHQAIQVTASVGFATSRFLIGASIVHEVRDALARAKADGGDCIRAGRDLIELQFVA